jgi:uncharacterized membrane protein HdeD (DUF308 family)
METLARNWWVLVVRGIFAILFGILAFVLPGATVFALVILFAAYMGVDGIMAIVLAIRRAQQRREWWPLVLEGLAGISVAVITVIWPDVTALALVYLIAAWALITGVMEIVAAIRLRKVIRGEFFLGLAGVASIAFGIIAIAFPGEGALALVWLIGSYAILFGVLLIALGLRLRSWRGPVATDAPTAAPA